MQKPMKNKTPQMIEALKQLFPYAMAAIQDGNCPICKKPVDQNEFRDTKSHKEYFISGMCQNCQDEIFDA